MNGITESGVVKHYYTTYTQEEFWELMLLNTAIHNCGGGWVWIPQFKIRRSVINTLAANGTHKISGDKITFTYARPDQLRTVNWWAD